MPMTLNIGLSRKVGDANYGSRGASVEIEMELESNLASEPAKLRERIRQLFDTVRTSLAEELNGTQPPSANSTNGHFHGNGRQNGAKQGGVAQPPVRPATSSQIKAIYAIARSQKLDVSQFRERFQRERPEDLSVKEASGTIDDLKRKE